MLHDQVVVYPLYDIICNSLHGVFLLGRVLVERQFQGFFVKLMLLRKIFSLQSKAIVLALTYKVLDIVRELLLNEVFFLGLDPIFFNFCHECKDLTLLNQLSKHIMVQFMEYLVLEFFKDVVQVLNFSIIDHKFRFHLLSKLPLFLFQDLLFIINL